MAKYIQKQREVVEAWQYDTEKPIPVWVARKCHYLGDGKFTANSIIGMINVEKRDFIVQADNGVIIVTSKTFMEVYDPESSLEEE